MKKVFLFILFTQISIFSYSQFVAKAEIKEDIPGLCDKKSVYVLMELFGKDQKEAVCSKKETDIEKMLNDSVQFIKDKPSFKDKGIVNLIINCNGEVVQCKIDNKTQSPVLDEQIINIFKTLTSWKAGKLNGKKVDSMKLFSFEINEGKISLQ